MNIIVWYRNDLRVHDHPALSMAAQNGDHVIPVFILNTALLAGDHASSNRNRFLLESLANLKSNLRTIGADLVIRDGEPSQELASLAADVKAVAVYYTADYTPYALGRDKAIKDALTTKNIEFRSFGGRLAVDGLDKIRTKAGTVHKVFTPFWRAWGEIVRRPLAELPQKLAMPESVSVGKLPDFEAITKPDMLSPDVVKGGETAARARLMDWLESGIDGYHQGNNDMAADSTSHLSPYFHFGCLSVREIETMLPDSEGARAWHRQLAWRDFYNYVLFYSPHPEQEFQEKYRSLKWGQDYEMLKKWQDGQTGFPVVDAAMRQMRLTGWMHNRARLIVGSFLTKDLWLDWRLGEKYFMQMLLDGDMANNNGNWQWIASVGVDPAPVYRRLYNPATQAKNYDPTGAYIRRYVPELKNVPDKYLAEPHLMPIEIQKQSGCIIGVNYPAPIVDHKAARVAALERYHAIA